MTYKITTKNWNNEIMAMAECEAGVYCGFGITKKRAIANIVQRLKQTIAEEVNAVAGLSAQLGGTF